MKAKAFFLSRVLREKVLLVAFAVLALLMWFSRVSGNGRAMWEEYRSTRTELAAQQLWLEKGPEFEARAAKATQSLDPAKTLNATRLVGELNAMASEAGLSPDIGSQRTERSTQFDFHTVQVNVRRADLGALVKFYTALSARAPYMSLEQVTLAVDRANPGQLSASIRVVSVELGK